MKTVIVLAAATTLGMAYLSPSALAQTTVYSDNFATDSSLSSSYLNINNISGTADEWTFTSGSGLALTTAAGSKIDELAGSFSAASLVNAGDYISFVVNFSSPNIGQGGSSSAGALLFALDSSEGVGLLSAGAGPESPTATTGSTVSYEGNLGDIAFNNSPKTGSKMYVKGIGTGTKQNDLGYYSDALIDTQVSTTQPNSANANLINNDSYTLTYTITALNAGASQEQVTEQIYDNTLGAMEDNFSAGATNGATYLTPTTTYDTFDVGVYTGTETAGYNINMSSLSVLTGNINNVPEPASLALTGAGLALAYLIRRRR